MRASSISAFRYCSSTVVGLIARPTFARGPLEHSAKAGFCKTSYVIVIGPDKDGRVISTCKVVVA